MARSSPMNARSSFSRGTLGSQPTSFTRGTLGQPFRPSSYAMPAAPAARPAAAPAMPAARAAAPAMPAMPAARPVSAAPNWAGIPSARQSAVSNPLTGRPMGTEGLGRPLGAPAPSTPTPRADTSNLRGNNPLTGRPMGTEGLGRPLGSPVPFGGFFAEGGVAPAGAASIVGERGPEIIVPQAPTTVIPLDFTPDEEASTGRLVPSSQNGYTWQRGTGPAATPPPQAMPASPAALSLPVVPVTPPQPMPIMPSYPGDTRVNPVGRSANDPMRIAEQQRRRGNIRPIMQLGQMAMEQQARQAQDAANFAQQSAMFQAQQQVVNQRDASQWSQQQQLEAMRNAEAAKRDTANFQQQQQLESDRRAYENAQQLRKEQAGKIVRFENIPTPDGKGFIPVAVRADGSYDMAGGYIKMPQPEAPLPPGLVPQSAERGGVRYGVPKSAEDGYQIGSIPGPMVKDPLTNKDVPGPRIPVRINKKTGQYTRLTEEQAAAQGGAAAAAAPDKPAWLTWLEEQQAK